MKEYWFRRTFWGNATPIHWKGAVVLVLWVGSFFGSGSICDWSFKHSYPILGWVAIAVLVVLVVTGYILIEFRTEPRK